MVEHSLGKGEVTGSIPVISSRDSGAFLRVTIPHYSDMATQDVSRLWIAISAYAALAALVWFTIEDPRIRLIPLVLLVLFAMRSVLWHLRGRQAEKASTGEDPRHSS